MRISVSRESLKAALDACAKLVNVKAAKAFLRGVRIEAKDGKASVSATDLEEWLTISLEGAAIEREGSCLANLAELRLFVRDAQARRHIEIESDGGALKAATDINGNSIARGIKSGKLEDWPEFPKQPEKCFSVPNGFFEAIRQAAPASSSKDFRRALACVYVNEGLAVATDGHHLVAIPCASPFEKGFLLKPSKTFDLLKGECRVGIEHAEKGKGAGKLSVQCGNIAWTASLSDAEYPNWRQVVPAEKSMPLSILFDAKSAAEFLCAIPALKSNEGAIALRCSKDGVMAGSACDVAAFRTDALFSGAQPLDIELSAANLSRALELGLHELRMADAFSPVLFKSPAGAFMASMPLRQKKSVTATPKTEETTMTKQETTQHEVNVKPTGFNVVGNPTPAATQADPFEDLLKSAEEAKTAAKANYEAASQFARKLRDLQASLKRKEREQKSTRELIEKLKTASGF